MRDDIVQNVEQACTLPDRIRNEPFYELCTISGDQIHIEVFQAKRDGDTANWPDLVDLGIFRGQKESDVINCVVFYYEKGTSKNNFLRKEKFGAVLTKGKKTLKKIRETAT